MFARTTHPETTPADAHNRDESVVLLGVRELDEWAASGLPVLRPDGRPGTVI